MDRREALRTTTYVLGYSLTASVIGTTVLGCADAEVNQQAEGKSASEKWEPQFFTRSQADLVGDLAETIIPETDTPGAKSAGVVEFIDDELRFMTHAQDQYEFIKGLEIIQARCKDITGNQFGDCTPDERVKVIGTLEQEVLKDNGKINESTFYGKMKRLVIQGYYTSELVCKNVLRYDPVPTAFHGCIDMDTAERAWAL